MHLAICPRPRHWCEHPGILVWNKESHLVLKVHPQAAAVASLLPTGFSCIRCRVSRSDSFVVDSIASEDDSRKAPCSLKMLKARVDCFSAILSSSPSILGRDGPASASEIEMIRSADPSLIGRWQASPTIRSTFLICFSRAFLSISWERSIPTAS